MEMHDVNWYSCWIQVLPNLALIPNSSRNLTTAFFSDWFKTLNNKTESKSIKQQVYLSGRNLVKSWIA